MQNKMKKHLSVIISVVFFALTAISPLNVFAEEHEKNTLSVDTIEKITTVNNNVDKIRSDVNTAFDNDEYVEVLIKMNKQVDTQAVSNRALQSASPFNTKYETKINQRYAVVDALKSTAVISQKNLLSYLEEMKLTGEVQDFRSFYIVNMVYAKASKSVVERISKMAEVSSISLDNKIQVDWPTIDEITETPADINTMSEEDDAIEWSVKQVQAPAVWDTYGIRGEGVVVGVIDTGVAYDHEALREKWRGFNPDDPSNPNVEGNWFDAVEGQELPYDIPSKPHGSHVTGSILGSGPNGTNQIGVAPNAKFICSKAFTTQGGQDSWLLAAGEWMLAPGGNPAMAPDIINNSWGGGPGLDEWYRPMVKAWRDAGILPVFSAGNMPPGEVAPPASVSAPSNYPESFAVGAIDINKDRPIFTRLGPGPYDGDNKPDITGPGVNVRSSVPTGYQGGWNGTSMSAPHVSGSAALLLSANPALTPDEIEEILMSTAEPLTDGAYETTPNYGFGHGLVNAFNAVSAVTSGLGAIEGKVMREGTDTTEPEVVEHNALADLYQGFSNEVSVVLKDDVAIKSAYVQVQPKGQAYWITIPLSRSEGDHKLGTYKGKIPGQFIQVPGFEYKFSMVDYGNNEVTTDPISVDVKFGEVPDEFSTDFTEAPSKWQIMDGDWAWGEANKGPIEDGNKLVGTNLFGEYKNSSQSWFVTPPLDLRNTEYASVTLRQWYNFADGGDTGKILVTKDYGDNWEEIDEVTGVSDGWVNQYINLAEYAESETPIFVAFVMVTSFWGAADGWFLDDVSLNGEDTTAPAAPTGMDYENTSVGIKLSWNKSTEMDVKKYQVYRKTTEAGISFSLIGESDNQMFVDTDFENGETYNYALKAVDFAGNASEMSEAIEVVAPHIVVLYSSDFEDNDGGMITGGEENTWQWGTPVEGPAAAASGTKVWGTNLEGDYLINGNGYIETPEIDLTAQDNADLMYKEWLITEARYDYAKVEVTTDGENWSLLSSTDGKKDTWETVGVSLAEYAGSKIKLRFRLESDYLICKDGWFIDDIVISSTTDSAISFATDKITVETERASREDKQVFEINHKLENAKLVDLENYKPESVTSEEISGIPVEAVVTVVESGRTSKIDPLTGEYRMIHPANQDDDEWTIKVDAYGYYVETEKIKLEKDETAKVNFMLEEIPRGQIVGTVKNNRTGEVVEGAYVRIVNDGNVQPALTDENGMFTLENVLEGQWTIKVSHGDYFETESQVTVEGNQENPIEIEMEMFVGLGHELAYDDGEEDNARAFYEGGNGWLVRMTPEKFAMLKGINVKLYSTEWPKPGGDEFKVAAFTAKEDGTPNELVFVSEAIEGVRGDWNLVDVSKYGFATEDEFFVGLIQTNVSELSPGMCLDETEFNDRAFAYVDGGFQKLGADIGNPMVRANVEYELAEPVITTPAATAYTAEDNFDINGTVEGNTIVNIYVNNEKQTEVESVDGAFTANVTIVEGENTVTATAVVDGKETDKGNEVKIVRDLTAPVITITEPAEGSTINEEVVTFKGVIDEEHFSNATFEGEELVVDENGNFQKKVLLSVGGNEFTIKAFDKAGNETTKVATVIVNKDVPTFEEIKPSEDMLVKAGDVVEVAFRSNVKDGEAYFNVVIGNANPADSGDKGFKMSKSETDPYLYKGLWTVPEGISLVNARIKLEITDAAGNKAETFAPGKITTADNNKTPINILNVDVKQQFGGTVVEAEIENIDRFTQNPTLIIVVSDDMNRVVNISTASISELAPGKTVTLGSGFNTPGSGEYKVTVLVWDSIEGMTPLADSMEKDFVIE